MSDNTGGTIPQAARSVRQFAKACGFSVATFYNLGDADRPKTVKVGIRVLVIESPSEWLQRIGASGGVATRRWVKKPVRARKR